MIKTNKEYIEFWKSLDSDGMVEYADYLEKEWDRYRNLGFDISTFRSATYVSYDGEEVYSSREFMIHYLKSLDVMEEYYNKNIKKDG